MTDQRAKFQKPRFRKSFDKSERKSFASDERPQKTFEGERIAKVIARAGLGSRRDVESAIEQGRVAVNGKTIESPALNVTRGDKITFDGKPLPQIERTRLWLYHKPKGLVTTEFDPEGRPTVFEKLPRHLPRVVSVGRLDINTEGLLLLTNDGGLKRVLELPTTGWLRRYRVRAFGSITQDALDALRGGVEIEDIQYGPIDARIERQQGDNVWLMMGIREGKNREIKKIAEYLGLTVNRLIRMSYGPFQLKDLDAGDVEEIPTRKLRDQLGEKLSREANTNFEAPLVDEGERPMPMRGQSRTKRAFTNKATDKAARYAALQEGEDTPRRRIQSDKKSGRLTLEEKTLRDRKGRSVRVDDRRKTKREDENNEKDFSARRGKTFKDGKSRRDWFKSERSEGSDRPQRKPFRDSYKRSDDQEHRGFDKTSRGDKPFRKKSFANKPRDYNERETGETRDRYSRPERKTWEKRDRPERSQQKRSFSSRDRSTEDNNKFGRRANERSERSERKTWEPRERTERKPWAKRDNTERKPWEKRDGSSSKKPYSKKPDGFRKSEGDEKKPFRKSGFRDGAATFSKGPKREGFKRGGSSRNGEGRSGGPSKSRFGKAPPRKPR